MNYKFLNELERNLEIQAHSYLLQEDDKHYESQRRTEFAQISFANRLNAHIGQIKKFNLNNIDFEAKILEVCSDFVLIQSNSTKVLLNLNYLESVHDLDIKIKNLSKFEEKWNLRSAIRELMLEHQIVQIQINSGKIYQGKIINVFLNHFDFSTSYETISINLNLVALIKYPGTN